MGGRPDHSARPLGRPARAGATVLAVLVALVIAALAAGGAAASETPTSTSTSTPTSTSTSTPTSTPTSTTTSVGVAPTSVPPRSTVPSTVPRAPREVATTTTTVPLPPFTGPPPWYAGLFPPVTPVPFTGSPSAPKVGVLTDSLLTGGADDLTGALTDQGLQASVTVSPGYPTWALTSAAKQLAVQATQVLVVATGTNDLRDVAQGFRTLDQVRTSMDQLLASARVPCVVWVGVNTTNGLHGGGAGSFGDVRVGGPVINQTIRAAQAQSGRPSARTLYGDWATRSAGHLDWFRAVDDVHLSATGLAEYERLILDGVAACRTALTTVNDPYPTTDRSTAVARLDVTSTTTQGYGPSSGFADVTAFRNAFVSYGDHLVYDVQYYSKAARIGVDLVTTDGAYLRSSKAADQNGLLANPATLLDDRAGGRWYTRDIPLPSSFSGKVVDRLLVGGEADSVNAAGAVRRVRIVSSTGALRAVLWDGAEPGALRYSSSGGTAVAVSLQPAARR